MRTIAVRGKVYLDNYGRDWLPEVSVLGAPVVLTARLGKWKGYQDTHRALVNEGLKKLLSPNARDGALEPVTQELLDRHPLGEQTSRLLGNQRLYLVDPECLAG